MKLFLNKVTGLSLALGFTFFSMVSSANTPFELVDNFDGSGPFSEAYCHQAMPHYPCPRIENGKLRNAGGATGSLCLDKTFTVGEELTFETVFEKEGTAGGFSLHFDTLSHRHFALHYTERESYGAVCRYLAEDGRFRNLSCGEASEPETAAHFKLILNDRRWTVVRDGVTILNVRTPANMRVWDGQRNKVCLLLGGTSQYDEANLDYIKVSSK